MMSADFEFEINANSRLRSERQCVTAVRHTAVENLYTNLLLQYNKYFGPCSRAGRTTKRFDFTIRI